MLRLAAAAIVLSLSPTALADGPVSISVVSDKQAPRARILVQATGAAVHLPACRGVVWESFSADDQTYAPISTAPCGPAANAIKIDKDGTELTLDADPKAAQAVRAVLVVGHECKDERPFPLADCARTEVVEGPPIMVSRPAE